MVHYVSTHCQPPAPKEDEQWPGVQSCYWPIRLYLQDLLKETHLVGYLDCCWKLDKHFYSSKII